MAALSSLSRFSNWDLLPLTVVWCLF